MDLKSTKRMNGTANQHLNVDQPGTRPDDADQRDEAHELRDRDPYGCFATLRYRSPRAHQLAQDGYFERIIDTDLSDLGVEVLNPNTPLRRHRAHAEATPTVTSFGTICAAAATSRATTGAGPKPSPRSTHQPISGV